MSVVIGGVFCGGIHHNISINTGLGVCAVVHIFVMGRAFGCLACLWVKIPLQAEMLRLVFK
jgi:hypothetical protein